MVQMFNCVSYTDSTVQSSSSFTGSFLSVSFSSSGRILTLLQAVVFAPFVDGVTCNSQNMIGLPYLFVGVVDLSLVAFQVCCSFLLLVSSMFSVFVKSVSPFTTTVITFGLSSLVDLASISSQSGCWCCGDAPVSNQLSSASTVHRADCGTLHLQCIV